MKSFIFLTSFLFSSFCLANPTPSSKAEVLKLVLFENGSEMIDTPNDTQVSIIDWYLTTVNSEGNQDLTANGTLFSRISDAECTEQGNEVTCKVLSVAQEFVPDLNDRGLFCTGADYAERIVVVFTKTDSKLVFFSGMIDLSMSGGGPCGAGFE